MMVDVVQIRMGANHLFNGCFAVVREVRTWGLIIDVIGVSMQGAPSPVIYPARIRNGDFHPIGKAHWDVDTGKVIEGETDGKDNRTD